MFNIFPKFPYYVPYGHIPYEMKSFPMFLSHYTQQEDEKLQQICEEENITGKTLNAYPLIVPCKFDTKLINVQTADWQLN